ncbi:uncharacterized protein TNCV_4846621 [Trichonephila clavipes]|uniref:Uncharacterized protein n=1 Tax=Trichonephila clavipes TaxID=2585209 RepID=A0A8X6WLM3_TRICX|nr:uncharacterized protein TNCV_4846621 [Trichonephila clavipes]
MQHPEGSMQITWNLQHALAGVRYANDKNFSADTHHARLWRHSKRYLRLGDFDDFNFGNCVFLVVFFKKRSIMSRRKQRSAFDQVSEFDRGRIVAYRDIVDYLSEK